LGTCSAGGAPCAFDRILATSLGSYAVDIIVKGKTNRYVVWKDGKAMDVPLNAVAGKTRGLKLDGMMVQTARTSASASATERRHGHARGRVQRNAIAARP
jgi:6-phosphofructokinase 1